MQYLPSSKFIPYLKEGVFFRFKDKFFNQFVQKKFVQKIENEIQDEFGNPIFTYAFRNDQNLLKDNE